MVVASAIVNPEKTGLRPLNEEASDIFTRSPLIGFQQAKLRLDERRQLFENLLTGFLVVTQPVLVFRQVEEVINMPFHKKLGGVLGLSDGRLASRPRVFQIIFFQ